MGDFPYESVPVGSYLPVDALHFLRRNTTFVDACVSRWRRRPEERPLCLAGRSDGGPACTNMCSRSCGGFSLLTDSVTCCAMVGEL